ncbi:MAG: DNA recombination protein RmuC [Thiotrichales bacterium]|nr:DNA recombination protein RmuC [Thiotrichales bacterium]
MEIPPAVNFIALIALPVIALVLVWLLFVLRRTGQGGNTGQDLFQALEESKRKIDLLEQQHQDTRQQITELIVNLREKQVSSDSELREQLNTLLTGHQTAFEKRQTEAVKQLNESIQNGMTHSQKQINTHLDHNIEQLAKRVNQLTEKTERKLHEIGGLVEKRLNEGFRKTTETFADILKRLALIDEAQKKITELSSNVVSLQEVLADKRSRGAFGEVQLNALIANVMPESNYTTQYALPNNKVADCALFLPEPTGTILIDAKFPLESYRTMTDETLPEPERKAAEKQFKKDIQKHITDISEKYIIPGTTSDGAVMFIPAEAVFAEIQAHHPDLVEAAHTARVWMVSPTTLWATLNMARAVLKDAETREQVDIIKEHLGYLSKDFQRFQDRMDDLARHIKQAHDDVDKVNTSARKISNRFEKIEKLELENETPVTLPGEGQK